MSVKWNLRGLFFFSLLLSGVVNAMDWGQYALPSNSIRAKLDAIFGGGRSLDRLQRDGTWHNFGSAHWLVGKLTTAGGHTEFVVKAANHPAGETIVLLPGVEQIHTTQQNLSRIKRAAEVDAVIQKKGLRRVRVPQTWIYPLSGNDAMLAKTDLQDRDVIIVEEMVKKDGIEMQNISQNPSIQLLVQQDAIRLDAEAFEELVTVAIEARIPDLAPNNFMIDQHGKIVLIDLEDILSREEEMVSQSPFYLRPIKRYKLGQKRSGSALFGLGLGGMMQEDDALKWRGVKLLCRGFGTLLIKHNAFEIGGVSTAIALMIRRVQRMRQMDRFTIRCRAVVREHVTEELIRCSKAHESMTDDLYREVTRKAVQTVVPHEEREEIIAAFATIAMAEDMNKDDSVTILGEQYISSQDAVTKSVARIRATWKSDWSIPSKITRGVKALVHGVRSLFNKGDVLSREGSLVVA